MSSSGTPGPAARCWPSHAEARSATYSGGLQQAAHWRSWRDHPTRHHALSAGWTVPAHDGCEDGSERPTCHNRDPFVPGTTLEVTMEAELARFARARQRLVPRSKTVGACQAELAPRR